MIFDCFTFFSELDLLDLRLHTLSPHVDRFVIAEADHTFQGQPKPFYYYENRHLYSHFESKIIWVPVRMASPATDTWTPWEREFHQRRAMRRQLLDLGSSSKDIILLSDVDEIPDLEGKVLHEGRSWQELLTGTGNPAPVVWVQTMTYYWVDLYVTDWRGTVAMRLGDIDRQLNGDFQKLRNQRGAKAYLVHPGGWHFSFLGGEHAIREKIKAFSHTEFRHVAEDPAAIHWAVTQQWKQGIDLFGRNIYKFRPLAAEERKRLPGYLIANRARFSQYFRPHDEDLQTDGVPGVRSHDL